MIEAPPEVWASMHVVLCDICDRGIRGTAFELHFVRGEAVLNEQAPLRVASGGTRLLYVCEACGNWLQLAVEHLTRAFREADGVMHLVEGRSDWSG
jgi:hypothetical protein